jgi:hypothetical protein
MLIDWIYRKRWMFAIASILGGAFFALFTHLKIENGQKYIHAADLPYLLISWWVALIALYAFWLAETLRGKLRYKSSTRKFIKMFIPSVFLLASVCATCKMLYDFN